ncbi:MAG TPA: hypothetical protein VGB85_28795 [Nannocystis sp.]|jgi:hypothetical protein
MLWDLGTPQDLGDPAPPGCKGKVDFLFAMSRGPNMAQIQEQFIASFEPFITSIEGLGDEFEDFDFHIMVVDGDDHWGSVYCDDKCEQDGVCDLTVSYPCDYEPTACDQALGAGTIYNAGRDAPNKHCGLAGGKRYLDKSNFGLQETFACIAQVGSAGEDDLGNALAQAVTTQRDTCNSGFLRDDALLVVVFIMTGDVLPGVDGIPQYWANALIDAKGGDLDAIVMLGMAGAGPFEKCVDYYDNEMCQMLALFPHRVWADPNIADYGPAFQETLALIDVACEEFAPG